MKLKLTELKLSAVDKRTGQEYPICRYECGHLDKNKDGVRYVLEGYYNGFPAVRGPCEVEVYIELDANALSNILIMMWGGIQDLIKKEDVK